MTVTKLDITNQASFTGNTSVGFKLTSVTDPTSAQDAATKNYVDSVATGLFPKAAVQWAATAGLTYTISAGSVTTITGTTVDGGSPAVGDRILIKDAPASTGTGSALSTQPGNGIYVVSSNTTNLTVARSTDMNTPNNPSGAYTLTEEGTVSKGVGYVVVTPTTNTGFVYNTSSIQWAPFSTGSGTVTAVSVVSANGLAGSSSGGATPALTLSTTITGILKGNGTAISAATPGTDYLVQSGKVTRETPSGAVNGSNTSYTLANTPVVGTEEVFLNGLLQEPGSGNDYTISGGTITYLTAPLSGYRLRVSYFK